VSGWRVMGVGLGALAVCSVGLAQGSKPVVTVAADGAGEYKTVQAAVDAASETGEVIRIAPGVYREKPTSAPVTTTSRLRAAVARSRI
jgi:pectinesterase